MYLPGLFGSQLVIATPNPRLGLVIWISAWSALSGIVLQLQLNADGRSPGAQTYGFPIVANKILDQFYAPFQQWLQAQGYNVFPAAYDWRLTIADIADAVLGDVLLQFGDESFVFVAHSMGGLVARAVAAKLGQSGRGDQVLGLITLGTPHYGSLSAVAMLLRHRGLLRENGPGGRQTVSGRHSTAEHADRSDMRAAGQLFTSSSASVIQGRCSRLTRRVPRRFTTPRSISAAMNFLYLLRSRRPHGPRTQSRYLAALRP